MKFIFKVLCVILSQVHLCCAYEVAQDSDVKYYVAADHIVVHEGKILILFGEMLLQAKSIFQDEQGIYFVREGVSWICGWCGELNDLGSIACAACKQPYDSSPSKKR